MSSTWSFRRSASDAKLAGVCGGVADRWNLDPVLVRIGFVLLALTGGIGVILYLAGWLLFPVTGSDRAAVDDLFGGAAARWPRELWITLVVVACIVSFTIFGAVSPFGVAPAIALAALWWFGFHRPRTRGDRSARTRRRGAYTSGTESSVGPVPPVPPAPWSAGPATPFTRAATEWQARVAEVRSGVWTAPTVHPPRDVRQPEPAAAARPPQDQVWEPVPAAPAVNADQRARAAFLAEPDPVGLYTEPAPVPVVRHGATLGARRLRLVTVAALGLTWLGLGVADALGVAVSFAVYAGSGLLVLALGLVAATRWGRARGMLPAGVLLAVTAVAASGFVGPTLEGPARQATGMLAHPVVHTSAATFPVDGDRLDTGELDVDLTGLTLTSDATYRADVDTGRILVRTPPGTGVDLRYTVDTGHVQAYGRDVASGTELHAERLLVPPAAGQHTLTLDLRLDTGLVEVRS